METSPENVQYANTLEMHAVSSRVTLPQGCVIGYAVSLGYKYGIDWRSGAESRYASSRSASHLISSSSSSSSSTTVGSFFGTFNGTFTEACYKCMFPTGKEITSWANS